VFFGVASVAISQLVPADRRGAALSLLVGGITVANILGLPAGTAIGNAFGWRVTFVAIAVMALLSVVAVLFAMPSETKGEAEADAPLKLQAAQLMHQQVFLSYLAIAIIMIGQIAFGTFQVAILTEVTGLDPVGAVPFYLLIGGAGAVVGIWLGGRAADWNVDLSILVVCIAQVACFALLLVAVHNAIAVAIMLFLGSAFGFGFSTPIQVRILDGAKAAPRLAATFVSTAYNVGIAGGAAIGAALLTAGVSYATLPATGIVCSTAAGLLVLISSRLARTKAA
jgi:DHA1 family inner membrane transport protein